MPWLDPDQPRSVRTFNPGAINFGPFAQRHGAIGSDGRLAIFPDVETGRRAMSGLLDVYGRRGQNTVASIIGGTPDKPNLAWAPRGVDNNSTDLYIKTVAGKLGVDPNATLGPEHRDALVNAMADYEAGGRSGLGGLQRTAEPRQDVAPPRQGDGRMPDQEEPGFLQGLAGRMSNPLFQQGLGMFLAASQGGDLNKGVDSGADRALSLHKIMLSSAEAERQRQARQSLQGLLSNPAALTAAGVPAALVDIARVTGDPSTIASYIAKNTESDSDREKAAAAVKLHRSHADYYDAAAKNLQAKTAPAPERRAEIEYGLGEDGEVFPIRSQSRVLGAAGAVPDSTTVEHRDYGPAGRPGEGVPGVAVDRRGVPSILGTQTMMGQRALDTVEEAARRRLLEAKRNQEIGTYLHGKPPAGQAYDSNMRLVPLGKKDSVTDRQSIVIAEQGLKRLKEAQTILTGDDKSPARTGMVEQFLGDEWKVPGIGNVGGWGEAGRGFRGAKAAVMDLNFALSGKSVSNAEREAFLDLYMPRSTDSTTTQKWKMGVISDFFSNVLRARKTGATDDEIAGLYRKAMSDGEAGPPGAARQPAPGSIRSKYKGLE